MQYDFIINHRTVSTVDPPYYISITIKNHLINNCKISISLFYHKIYCYFQIPFYNHLLPAATNLGQGNIFTRMCLSTGVSVSVHAGIPPWSRHHPLRRQTPLEAAPREQTPPGSRPPRSIHPLNPGADTPPDQAPRSIRLTSRWYASYWNAFLLNILVSFKKEQYILFLILPHLFQMSDFL